MTVRNMFQRIKYGTQITRIERILHRFKITDSPSKKIRVNRYNLYNLWANIYAL